MTALSKASRTYEGQTGLLVREGARHMKKSATLTVIKIGVQQFGNA
jgi:hypothetical protein